MTLREARCLFTRLLCQLIGEAIRQGFEVAIGEVTRDARMAQLNAQQGKGISNSLHLVGLAADLNLYRQGVFLGDTASHSTLGAYWKELHPSCRWGGDFKRQDGNHYSLSWEGRA